MAIPEIHFIGVSKTNDKSMTREYRVQTEPIEYGALGHHTIKTVEELFREGTNSVATASGGQPLPLIGKADYEFTYLKALDAAVSHNASGSKGDWIFNVKVAFGPLEDDAATNQNRTEAALKPWQREARWSSAESTLEKFESFDVDGNPLIFSNGQPFVSPVSVGSVMVYTLTGATTTKPWANQSLYIKTVNSSSISISELAINPAAETLYCSGYTVTEERYEDEEGTVTPYYNYAKSVSYLSDGSTWVDHIQDMIQYEVKQIGDPLKWYRVTPKDGKAKDRTPQLGNGAGELLDLNNDNIPGATGTGKYDVPLSLPSTGKSVQQKSAYLEYWFKKRISFTGLGLNG